MMACMSNLMAGEFSEEELACKGEIMELKESDMDKDEEDEDAFEFPDSCELLNLTDEQKEALKNCDLEDKVACLNPTTEGGMTLTQRQRVPRVVIKSANCVEDLFGCERKVIRNNLKSPKTCMGAEMPEVPDMGGAMSDMGGAGKPGMGKKMKCYKK